MRLKEPLEAGRDIPPIDLGVEEFKNPVRSKHRAQIYPEPQNTPDVSPGIHPVK